MKRAVILFILSAIFCQLTISNIQNKRPLVSAVLLGYVDVPAQIPARIKVPAGCSYKIGQRVMCKPYYTLSSEKMQNLYTPGSKGGFPIVITGIARKE
ncbi:hypothetical protein [Spirosoma endbachense]|uniref:Uncharacterized protein n=1 Tax=Spirosoma endbachense TaxID=2666025 RepID=A0A6P1VWQ5_9BACT|nr:hypothetical protein [Spirosoma endbachense]QHV96270.1 hypothetical protein GJR95_15155 [Spirosoma endbachense]